MSEADPTIEAPASQSHVWEGARAVTCSIARVVFPSCGGFMSCDRCPVPCSVDGIFILLNPARCARDVPGDGCKPGAARA